MTAYFFLQDLILESNTDTEFYLYESVCSTAMYL